MLLSGKGPRGSARRSASWYSVKRSKYLRVYNFFFFPLVEEIFNHLIAFVQQVLKDQFHLSSAVILFDDGLMLVDYDSNIF